MTKRNIFFRAYAIIVKKNIRNVRFSFVTMYETYTSNEEVFLFIRTLSTLLKVANWSFYYTDTWTFILH